jgi:hypothetical protein
MNPAGGAMTYKMVVFSKRRKDLSIEQMKDYWLTTHAALEKKVVAAKGSAVYKIVANIAVPRDDGKEPRWDGFGEVYMNPDFQAPDSEAQQEVSTLMKMLSDDEKYFRDTLQPKVYLQMDETILFDQKDREDRSALTKGITLAKRLPGTTRGRMKQYLLNEHSQLWKNRSDEIPGVIRFAANIVTGGKGGEEPWDTMLVCYTNQFGGPLKYDAPEDELTRDAMKFLSPPFEACIVEEYIVAERK